MKIPFLEIGISFAAGIALSLVIPSGIWLWILLFLFLPLLFFSKGRNWFSPVLWSVFLILGILHGQFDSRKIEPAILKQIQRPEFKNPASVSGRVITEPQKKIRGRRETLSFILEANVLALRAGNRMKYFRSDGKVQVFLNQSAVVPQTGDRLRLWGELKLLEPPRNPSGFDYQRYLQNQDVAAIMTVYGKKSARILNPGGWNFFRMVSRWRLGLASHIEELFRGEDAAFIKALILGMRKDISNTRNNEFLKTGTSHLLAISGLNIAMAAGSFYLILLCCKIPQKAAAGFSLGVTLLQVLIAGLGLPVQRAGIMAGAGFAALLLEREKSGLNLFFLAFFALLWLDTRYLWNISFQLSFFSLFWLMIFPHWFYIKNAWLSAFANTAAVLLGTFPLVVYHFNVFSPMGILANFLGIPLFHWTLLSAFLALLLGKIPFLGSALTGTCHYVLQAGLNWISICSKPDWGYWFLAKPSFFHLEIYYFTLGLWLLSLKLPLLKRRILQGFFLSCWFVSFAVFFRSPVADRFQMTLWSAGSNEIAHVQFGKKNHWLLNAGRTFPGDQAQWIITPYLRALGLKELTGILFTDWKKRHVSGLSSLQEQFRFRYLIYPWPGMKARISEEPEKLYLQYGDRIKMPEGGSIEILEQSKASFVFEIKNSEANFLFLYSFPHENGKFLKPADVLIFSSEISRSPEEDLKQWIKKVKPKLIIAPQGNGILLPENILRLDLETSGAVTLIPEMTGTQKQLEIQTQSGKSFEIPLR